MWQVLLAAAVAGSGILAKRLIFNSDGTQPVSVSIQNDQKCLNESLQSQDSVFWGNDDGVQESTLKEQSDGSIFRFSSTSGAEKSSNNKNVRKKIRGVSSRGKMEGLKENSKGNAAKKCGVSGCEKRGWVVDQRGGGNGKKVSVCLKKRRTSKIASGKCQSCTSKANSVFSWGLSVGIMYMMSAGKAEISKLNNAMDETSKIVQELKAELSRRKTPPNSYAANVPTKLELQPKNNREMVAQSVVKKPISEKGVPVKVFAFPTAEEGECSSSVVTEEQQPEAFEMDQLEAELETELQKLPWSTMECLGFEDRTDTFEDEVSAREFHRTDDENLYSHQPSGVLPSVLDQKLCHLLIEQQEGQIMELESKLQRTHSKLNEKEVELQTLKDCVKRLTEFSLGNASDEETDIQVEDEKTSLKDQEMELGTELGSRSMVGMKRAMDFESYHCFSR
ncbi:hypothetical protein M9H77_24646 [Catharanthus roseus]|uniref:Uncharacterized protein n=1 Tax=Catharanthus roseus TaxID=4058 RepID=A0ACC0AWE2_CATRO|nr:hypothetical protein M9H77_24646 [Catharanthus roseus]